MIEILLAILVGVLTDELLGWSGRFAIWLVRRNARKAPARLADRLEEEWVAHLHELPGRLSRVLFAIDCRRAAFILARREFTRSFERELMWTRSLDLGFAITTFTLCLPVNLVIWPLIRSGVMGFSTARLTCVGRHGHPFSYVRIRCSGSSRIHLLIASLGEVIPGLTTLARGEISLVGPRIMTAKLRAELAKVDPRYAVPPIVKPGLIPVGIVFRWLGVSVDAEGGCEDLAYERYFEKHYGFALFVKLFIAGYQCVVHANEAR